MAVSRDSTVLPRRTLLQGAAATLAAAPAMMALPARAVTEDGDPAFTAMREKAVAAWAKLTAGYAAQERRIEALRPVPELPQILSQPLRLPGKAAATLAPENGWSAESLSNIIMKGTYLVIDGKDTPRGRTMRVEWLPVSAKTRKRAAELLKVREAYDAARDAWWEKVHAIEDESAEPLAEAIDLGFALMAYPVFTVAEVRDKLALAHEWDLFNLSEVGDQSLRDTLIRDALATAEKAIVHV